MAKVQPSQSVPLEQPLLLPKARTILADQQWSRDAKDVGFVDHVFVRSSAKNLAFTRVDFRYCVLDACYFRSCRFDSCDFTGCRFVGTNFHGSTFTGCKFDYAFFERTLIDAGILDTSCPPFENVKSRFARTLRVNFQSLGDAGSANRAIVVELDATREHLRNAWRSNESYYRHKYKGRVRAGAFFDWLGFRVLDFLWGNGESPWKLLRSVGLFLLVVALTDTIAHRDPWEVSSYLAALVYSPQLVLGTAISPFGGLASAAIVFVRLITISLLISILVRRFVRR